MAIFVLTLISRAASAPAEVSDELTLENGAGLVLLPAPEAERVEGRLLLTCGSLHDPRDLEGLARALGATLAEGGSKDHSGKQWSAWLEARDAVLDVQVEAEHLVVRFTCPASELKATLGGMVALVRAPALPKKVVEEVRERLAAQTAATSSDVEEIADRMLLRLAYGEDSPFARRPTARSLAAVTAESLAAFHAAHFGPNRLWIGLAGPLDSPEALRAQVVKLLEDWKPASQAPEIHGPAFLLPLSTTIYAVDVPGAQNVELRVACIGTSRTDRYTTALDAWSQVYVGMGSESRLGELLAEDSASVLSLGGGYLPGWRRAGMFLTKCAVRAKPGAVGDALRGMLDRLTAAASQLRAPTEKEFRSALARIQARRAEREASPGALLDWRLALAVHGIPDGYDDAYEQDLMRLDGRKLVNALEKYLFPARLLVVAAGPAERIVPELEAIAEVIVRKPEYEPHVTPAAGERIDRMLEAMGGRERWAALQTVYVKLNVQLMQNGVQLSDTYIDQWRYLDAPRMRLDTNDVGTKQSLVVDGSRSWKRTAITLSELDPLEHANLVLASRTWLYNLLHDCARGGALSASVDEEGRLVLEDERGPLAGIELDEEGRPARMFTGRGKHAVTYEYSDWQESDGYSYAAKFLQVERGVYTTMLEFRPNPPLEPDLFLNPRR